MIHDEGKEETQDPFVCALNKECLFLSDISDITYTCTMRIGVVASADHRFPHLSLFATVLKFFLSIFGTIKMEYFLFANQPHDQPRANQANNQAGSQPLTCHFIA